ncbi:hypothetical protein D9M69_204510 [compost metagenome]
MIFPSHIAKAVRLESLTVQAPRTSKVLLSTITPVMLSRPTALEVSTPIVISRLGIPASTSDLGMYHLIE